MKNIAIIGGGLSGLYAAYKLQNTCHVMLFEARDRLGGRIHAIHGLDLGPSWIWPHQRRIINLVDSLGLEIFRQYDIGDALYETPQTVERFIAPAMSPSARIQGGTSGVIERLAAQLMTEKIHLNEAVISVRQHNNCIVLITSKQEYEFDEVIVTLPPRLAIQALSYDPPLPDEIHRLFSNIPTWMGNSIKCVIEFEEPFWRDMGLSGFCFSHTGPIGEMHDACTQDRYALFGFVRSNVNMENIEHLVRSQLKNLFGDHVSKIIGFHYVDWRSERFTSVDADQLHHDSHPQYGIEAVHFDGRLRFIGTETAFDDGGYLEGAIASVDQLKNICD